MSRIKPWLRVREYCRAVVSGLRSGWRKGRAKAATSELVRELRQRPEDDLLRHWLLGIERMSTDLPPGWSWFSDEHRNAGVCAVCPGHNDGSRCTTSAGGGDRTDHAREAWRLAESCGADLRVDP